MLPSIRDRNAMFASLTPDQQRVEVAKDVLSQLALKHLIATSGVYVNLGVAEECKVCALGAIGVSVLNGDAKNNAYVLRDGLSDIFSEDDLVKIEDAFELWEEYEYGGGEDFTDEQRLTQIMQNIVDNNGNFDGTQLPWYAPEEDE